MKKLSKMPLPCNFLVIVIFVSVINSPNPVHGNLGDEFATADFEKPLEAIKSEYTTIR